MKPLIFNFAQTLISFTSTLQYCTQFGFKSVLHRNIYWCLTEDKIDDTCQNY